MKLSAVNNSENTKHYQQQEQNKQQSFKGVIDGLVDFWQFVDNGGRAVQFTVEDMCGTNFPRSIKGLLAGKKYTGRFNIPAFLQEAIREFLTGPTMCITPWVIITLAMKANKSADIHRENISNLSYLFNKTAVSEGQNIKDAFYTTVVKDMYNKTLGYDVSDEHINEMVSLFKKLENVGEGKQKEKEIKGEIQELYEKVIKGKDKYEKGINFLNTSYSVSESKEGTTRLQNYASYATSYIKDYVNKFGADKANIEKFKSIALGRRSLIIVSMVAITGILMSQIPKIYTKASGKVNPNASAIYDEAKKNQNSQNKVQNLENSENTSQKPSKTKNILTGIFAIVAATAAVGALLFKNKDSSPMLQNMFNKLNELTQGMGEKTNKLFEQIGKMTDNESADKIFKLYEPTGANNSFMGLVTLMFGMVIAPRVLTAAKRNPNDKEATKDEITEILCRDLITVLTILFALKSTNSLIGAAATKLTGIPMTTKPYQSLFDNSIKGFKNKVLDFMSNPLDKLRTIGKNILDTLHPTGGVRLSTNDENTSKFSNYTFDCMAKILNCVEEEKGDKNKVFEKIVDGAIEKCKKALNGDEKKGIFGITERIRLAANKNGGGIKSLVVEKENLETIIENLKQLKEKGIEGLEDLEKNTGEALNAFLNDKNNSLVKSTKRLNAFLRTMALAIESGFLGWGLPALNQKRLERKYLKNQDTFEGTLEDRSQASLLDKNIKAREIKLYHSFLSNKVQSN